MRNIAVWDVRELDAGELIEIGAGEVLGAADADVRAKFTQQGAEPVIMTPDEVQKFAASEVIKWRDIITQAHIPQID